MTRFGIVLGVICFLTFPFTRIGRSFEGEQAKIEQIGRSLEKVAATLNIGPFQYGIEVDEEPKAYAQPELMEVIVNVTTGMLALIEWNEGELAFLLGHELGHLAIPRYPDLAPQTWKDLSHLCRLCSEVQGARWIEAMADTVGVFFMAQAGYNPSRAADYFEKMVAYRAKKERVKEGIQLSTFNEQRLENIRGLLPHMLPIYAYAARSRQSELATAPPPPQGQPSSCGNMARIGQRAVWQWEDLKVEGTIQGFEEKPTCRFKVKGPLELSVLLSPQEVELR